MIPTAEQLEEWVLAIDCAIPRPTDVERMESVIAFLRSPELREALLAQKQKVDEIWKRERDYQWKKHEAEVISAERERLMQEQWEKKIKAEVRAMDNKERETP